MPLVILRFSEIVNYCEAIKFKDFDQGIKKFVTFIIVYFYISIVKIFIYPLTFKLISERKYWQMSSFDETKAEQVKPI